MKTKQANKTFIALIFAIILSVGCIFGAFFADVYTADAAEADTLNKPAVEVLSYTDVFRSYYDQATELINDNADICSFEVFCSNYYDSGLDLPHYTDSVVNAAAYNSDVIEVQPMASNDADYIMSATDYEYTPASEFQRVPVYEAYDYSLIKEGDIVYETDTILFNAGHNTLIYDIDKDGAYGNYIQTIEAVGGGVQFGFLDDTRIVDFGVKILRVQGADDEVIDMAKYFIHEQLGKDYFLNITRLNTSIDSDSWYCSELVYAAYKYAGIDIGVKKNDKGEDVYLSLGCIPSDIYKSYNTYEVEMIATEPYFLEIAIVGKSSSIWTIAVTNSTARDMSFEYNTRMCFKGDAQTWSGLNDIEVAEVKAGETVSVDIQENLFATSIVFSRIENGKRYITYAYGLNKNDKTMKIEYCII